MSGALGALLFAAGVGLVWFGALTDLPARTLRRLRAVTGVAVSELALRVGLPALVLAPLCGLVAWRLLGVPALALLAAGAGCGSFSGAKVLRFGVFLEYCIPA